jgi:hypothetical protein
MAHFTLVAQRYGTPEKPKTPKDLLLETVQVYRERTVLEGQVRELTEMLEGRDRTISELNLRNASLTVAELRAKEHADDAIIAMGRALRPIEAAREQISLSVKSLIRVLEDTLEQFRQQHREELEPAILVLDHNLGIIRGVDETVDGLEEQARVIRDTWFPPEWSEPTASEPAAAEAPAPEARASVEFETIELDPVTLRPMAEESPGVNSGDRTTLLGGLEPAVLSAPMPPNFPPEERTLVGLPQPTPSSPDENSEHEPS